VVPSSVGTRRHAGAALFLLGSLLTGCAHPAPDAPRRRPNILFILTDDHAAHALSCYGSNRNRTPQLDRLASSGMRFDRAFVTNSICTPSRASMLTGLYSHGNGTPVFNRFDGSQPTVPKALQAAGYHTGIVGKWHLGSVPTGFDTWTVLPGQGRYRDPVFVSAAGRRVVKGYVTDVVTDLALEFLAQRPKDKPFFLALHHKAPHREWEPDPKHAAMFTALVPEPATLHDDYATRTGAARNATMRVAQHLTRRDLKLVPPAGLVGAERERWLNTFPDEVEVDVGGERRTLTGAALAAWKYQRYMQDYLACVASVDDNVGRVLDALEREGLAGDTLVVYTSDNGFFLGEHGFYDKRFMYEESLRVPLLVRWPGVTRPGSTTTDMALNVDFAPTLLAAAGVKDVWPMHGRDLRMVLAGQTPADWRRSFYYRYYHDPGDHNTPAHLGVRTATHKLIHFWKQDQWELFDLVADPHEVRNVYGDPRYATTQAALHVELARVKAEVGDDDRFADVQPGYGVSGPEVEGTRQ
jgi:arylsulfatase A-like enzyme